MKRLLGILFIVLVLTGCTQTNYLNHLNEMPTWKNELETSIAQTEVNKMVMDFMESKSPKDKKVLVVGWDGANAESIANVVDMGLEISGYNPNQYFSGVNELLSDGGGAYLAYSGGFKKGETEQETSTAPGWAAILTGKWGIENGVVTNDDTLDQNEHTFIYTLAKAGYPSTFVARWDDHFTKTYKTEIDQIGDLPLDYVQLDSDLETHNYLVNLLKTNEKDVVFAIYEDVDYNGHTTGFGNTNPKYTNSVKNVDMLTSELFQTVKQRATYEDEEWLFIITSDHGGYKTRHGMQTAQERQTFIVTNQTLEQKYFSQGYDGYKVK